MPTNLPPEYVTAERRYKEAPEHEKVEALMALISTVPKHKGTDKLRAGLRKRLSKLKDASQRAKKTGKSDLYTVSREGAAQAALVGFANSGKSALVGALTNAEPHIAEYPITTVMPQQGMMRYEDIQFQLVDLPPIGNESTDGWVSGILRTAGVLVLVLDASDEPALEIELILEQLTGWNIYLRGEEAEGVHKKCLIALNKSDLLGPEGAQAPHELLEFCSGWAEVVPVSASEALGLGVFREALFRVSGVLRVYTKEPGKPPDMGRPFTLKKGSTVMDLARMVHKDFAAGLKFACLWGASKFPGQKVHRDHLLVDKDVLELHI